MYKQIQANKRKSLLLLILFALFVVALGFVLSKALEGGISLIIIAAFIAIIWTLVNYYSGDKIALLLAGAKGPIKKEDNPYVFRIVENLCITAGLPLPKIYIIPDPAPNAFATGRDPKHASLALTQGLIDLLENEELEGVIAHELSHIKNFDIRLMMLVIVCVTFIIFLADWFLRGLFWGGFSRSRRSREGSAQGIFLIIAILLAILAPILAQILQLAISRKREFLADASAALLTRYPQGLAKALEKISKYPYPLRRASNATAHLYISDPRGKKTGWFYRLFSTHPPVEERIKALYNMERNL